MVKTFICGWLTGLVLTVLAIEVVDEVTYRLYRRRSGLYG